MRLGVNIDHVATVRQARRSQVPDPVEAALVCQRAGADRIVCQLRDDRRDIKDRDVQRLIERLLIPVNLEMSIAPDIVKSALRLKPHQVTLVPERRQELTTEGGLHVVRFVSQLTRIVDRFHQQAIPVSLFIDPVASQITAARKTGAPIIELHTGGYATTYTTATRSRQLRILQRAARMAHDAGLAVAAGHGLDYSNVRAIVSIRQVEELNIGFAIVARSIFVGLTKAVQDMTRLLRRGPR